MKSNFFTALSIDVTTAQRLNSIGPELTGRENTASFCINIEFVKSKHPGLRINDLFPFWVQQQVLCNIARILLYCISCMYNIIIHMEASSLLYLKQFMKHGLYRGQFPRFLDNQDKT